MSNYSKTTDFAAKDSLPSGDAAKIIRGSEFETEFDNISTAIATKADSASPTFTGTVTIDGLTVDGNTTLGNAATDTVTVTADIASNLIPSADNTHDLGASGAEWKDLYVDGTAYVDTLDLNGTAVTSTAAELNLLDGATVTTAEINILDGVTATTAEINLLDGVTSTTAELNILDGVTATAAELNIMDGVTATTAELNLLDGVTSTTAELNILDGVTSTATELNLLDGITGILDEDNMASNSATALATQQSIKTYVDSQVATADTLAEVLANGNTTGGTDVAFGDNDKAIFGAGSDLSIYHDGSNSYIEETGTGSLFIRGQGRIKLQNSAGDETLADFLVNDRVDLYYDNSIKLATTSTGINVTGSVVSDGLDVDGSSSGDITLTGASTSNTGLFVKDPTATTYGAFFGYDDANTVVHIGGITNGTKNAALVIGRDNNIVQFSGGGDVQFYEDTGTTVKMNWDASAESLGIGVGAPQASLHIANDASRTQFIASGTVGNDRFLAIDLDITGSEDVAYITCDQADSLAFGEKTNDNDRTILNEHMRIDASGNVGIGTSSPSAQLEVASSADAQIRISDSTSANQRLDLEHNAGVSEIISGNNGAFGSVKIQAFNGTSTVDRLQIKPSGDIEFYEDTGTTAKFFWDASAESLGIGTSSPSRSLHINSGTVNVVAKFESSDSIAAVEFVDSDTTTNPNMGAVGDDLRFVTNNAEAMRIDSSGHLIVPNGVTLGTAVGTYAADNTLDDYEEGTFTPELADASSGGNTGTATTIEGRYTKVGRQIVVVIKIEDIDTTGMTGANNIFIRNLPFTAGSGTTGQSQGSLRLDRVDLNADCCGVVSSTTSNTTYLTLRQTVDNSADVQIKVQDFTSGSADIFATITYFE